MAIRSQGRRGIRAAEAGPLPDSLAFLTRYDFAPEILVEAGRIARACGVEPDEALLCCGLATEEAVYRTLAAEVGLPFLAGELPIHPMARFPEACLTGVVPLAPTALGSGVAYAPRGSQFAELVARKGRVASGVAITTPSNLQREVLRARGRLVAGLASEGLPRNTPELSAREGLNLPQCLALLLTALVTGLCFVLWPRSTWLSLTTGCGIAFLGATVLRLASVAERVAPSAPCLPRLPDTMLPVYTVLVPLFREARVLPRLLAALDALDYPPPKKDVKLVIEADDAEMAAGLAAIALPGWVEVVVAPPGLPRTKPRALNVALPLARGEFVTVYDAEDVPDPAQLRLAVATFLRAPSDVVCLQARLVIDNTDDSLITRLFTLDYGALFDVINPALSRFDMPIPLGGTSNHFRTRILRGVGGWDAWNVTEDADLGIRLAAAGYRVADLPSATLEEAPRRLSAWIRQRRRWMKGFLQVSITHSRHPARLLRQLGPARLFGAAAMSFGTVASALGFPFFLAIAGYEIAIGDLLLASEPGEIFCASIGCTLFLCGFCAMLLPPFEAVRRRRLWRLAPFVPLMPFYFLLVSWAAWRGLADLIVDPHFWHKTDHGHARTSRSGRVAVNLVTDA